jgi:group I intron endonuclease
MNTTFIYSLADPITFEVRYVGKANDPYRRYCEHLIDKKHTHKTSWIRSLLKRGLLPIRQILEECDKTEWEKKERDWIAFEKRCGCQLTNTAEGGIASLGMKGKRHSEKTKRIMSLHSSLRGKHSLFRNKHHSEETKNKISQSHKGLKPWLGKHHTEETKTKIGESHRGIKISEVTRLKMKKSHTGHKHTEEHKKKISLSQKGRAPTIGFSGRHHSEETKEKMRNTLKDKFSKLRI